MFWIVEELTMRADIFQHVGGKLCLWTSRQDIYYGERNVLMLLCGYSMYDTYMCEEICLHICECASVVVGCNMDAYNMDSPV